ncbi:hypothetical protein [Nocardia sp. NPDC050406]|uniref:hypothetical protein n=1 Tax=Nocardia sp. NPDC050406 TaxID=3364318 RepID=UPI0037BB97C1
MAGFHTAVAALILVGVLAMMWQLPPQGARGERVPVIVLALISISNLLLTPAAEALFAGVRDNTSYLLSHLCVLTAVALTTVYWGDYLASASSGRRALTTCAGYGFVLVALVVLFATSPQRPHGLGFGREFAESPGMQLYWILQAIMMIHALSALAGVAARARARERHWRRGLLSVLTGVAVLFAVYEVWVIVVVTVWPTVPPLWAQWITSTFQIGATMLLVAGAIAPAVLGVLRSARLARSYIEQLAPLHDWLTRRYPQVRFRTRLVRRAETRVTDMLIEISDALRLLQRDAPTVAAAYGLDHDTLRAAADGSSQHAAYELGAARLFRSRNRLPHTENLML